jgi:hypothetical protein
LLGLTREKIFGQESFERGSAIFFFLFFFRSKGFGQDPTFLEASAIFAFALRALLCNLDGFRRRYWLLILIRFVEKG